jgi:hypothetical protein
MTNKNRNILLFNIIINEADCNAVRQLTSEKQGRQRGIQLGVMTQQHSHAPPISDAFDTQVLRSPAPSVRPSNSPTAARAPKLLWRNVCAMRGVKTGAGGMHACGSNCGQSDSGRPRACDHQRRRGLPIGWRFPPGMWPRNAQVPAPRQLVVRSSELRDDSLSRNGWPCCSQLSVPARIASNVTPVREPPT